MGLFFDFALLLDVELVFDFSLLLLDFLDFDGELATDFLDLAGDTLLDFEFVLFFGEAELFYFSLGADGLFF